MSTGGNSEMILNTCSKGCNIKFQPCKLDCALFNQIIIKNTNARSVLELAGTYLSKSSFVFSYKLLKYGIISSKQIYTLMQ